ncbi:MAG TPA: metallophosphoesterase [Thermomicrobiales bacterium]|nr:metallophosphoesterase [Thermomicrobiales bacterium]
MRIAAFSDLHIWGPVPKSITEEFQTLRERADILVIAGDITNNGFLVQAERAAVLLRTVQIPIVAVVGNHDRRTPRPARYRELIESAGVTLLDGSSIVFGDDLRVGFAGVQGSGGGFWPHEGPDTIPRRTAKALAVRGRREAARLDAALDALDADVKIVITHVSPTMTTLGNEPRFKFFLLGSSELARVVDKHDVDLVIHGHVHRGNTYGHTPGGTPVRNTSKNVVHQIQYFDAAELHQKRLASGMSAIA